MSETKPNLRVDAEALLAFTASVLQKSGLRPEDGQVTAENLIFANLRGVDSHGVIRLKVYAERLRAGGFKAQAIPTIAAEGDSFALIDGGHGVGQVATMKAMQVALGKAAKTGVAVASVKNGNHFGAAAFYALKAVEKGMIGFAATNAGATMAPTGGREGRLGNNPVAVAIPAGRHPSIVLDLATGAVAWGKIFLAQQEGKKIPSTWALSKDGLPTEDPNVAADRGMIQPFGGYKGYGLSFVLDILTGVLAGGGFSTHVKTLYQNLDQPSDVAHTCAALRIEGFMALGEFQRRVDELIDLMHACPKAPDVARIYVPGEIEHETEQRRRQEGIPLNSTLRDELVTLGRGLGLSVPF